MATLHVVYYPDNNAQDLLVSQNYHRYVWFLQPLDTLLQHKDPTIQAINKENTTNGNHRI